VKTHRRELISFGLAVAVSLGWAATSHAFQSRDEADEVLKKAGLKRVENSFVLDAELEATKLAKSVEKLETKVGQALKFEQDYQARIARDEQQAEALLAQANELKQNRTPAGLPKGVGMTLNDQINQLERQATQVRAATQKNPQVQAKRNEYLGTFDEDEKALKADRSRLMEQVKRVQKRYDELYEDEEVVDALRTLNHNTKPKVALGPIVAYARNVARQCADELRDQGLTHNKTLVYLTEEDDIGKQAKEAAQRLAKAKREKKVDASLRRELAQLAQELRAKAREFEAKRAALAKDEHVADLIAEVQKVTKGKVKLAPGLASFQAQRDLDQLEAGLK
jgi:hypothetical protein